MPSTKYGVTLTILATLTLTACSNSGASGRTRDSATSVRDLTSDTTPRPESDGFPTLTAPAFTDSTTARFAEIPFGIPLEQATRLLVAKGYAPHAVPTSESGDRRFLGEIAGRPADVTLMHGGGRYAKAFVTLLVPEGNALAAYRATRATLLAKYGTPSNTFDIYSYPYEAGDGHEETAIRLGKVTHSTYWNSVNVGIDLSRSLTVDITYESVAWPAESDRRKKQSEADL